MQQPSAPNPMVQDEIPDRMELLSRSSDSSGDIENRLRHEDLSDLEEEKEGENGLHMVGSSHYRIYDFD